MALNSKIEWCDHTLNLWWGCTKVHAGCDNCYAERESNRWGFEIWGNDNYRRCIISALDKLEEMQNKAFKEGKIRRVFIGSMMDLFEKPMPMIYGNELLKSDTGYYRDILFEGVPELTNLEFLFLTKRPSNINKYIPKGWKTNPPKNVMFGASIVNQATADKVMQQLKPVNGRKFLSVEPQLAELTLLPWLKTKSVDWVIQGGESGPKRRPFDTDWARKLRDECAKVKIPYFFKQVDKVKPIPEDLLIREFPRFGMAT